MGEPTAAELRARARRALAANGAYVRFLLGQFALDAIFLCAILLAVVFLRAVSGDAFEAFVADARNFELASRAAWGSGQWGPEVFDASAKVCRHASFACVLLLALTPAFYYFGAYRRWGLKAHAMAIARGGGSFGHFFSGWGWSWALAWLCLVRQCRVFLWSLLLVVPGLAAALSYALADFVKIDHPDWDASRCLAESERLMAGHRLRLLRLFLSYFGWILLALALTGVKIVKNFGFVLLGPYRLQGFAQFYEDLLDRDGTAGSEWEGGTTPC